VDDDKDARAFKSKDKVKVRNAKPVTLKKGEFKKLNGKRGGSRVERKPS